MGIFDLFKTQWSAGEMTQDDRKKIFWYLKRMTSYTAWQREVAAFDRFAAVYEKQVREEPHAPGPMDGTEWDFFYPSVLKAQVWYEQGLERLRQGDRSVWMYNERGIMRDAWSRALSWYEDMVLHGYHGDKFFFGKYIDELTQTITEFYEASLDAGYVQPMLAEPYSQEWWGPRIQSRINNRPLVSTIGAPTEYFSHIYFPEPLPDVPIPKKEVLIRSGDAIPVFGIYEPQVKDGCMNYLLGGGIAPTLMPEIGDNMLRVTWRLLWEDTRYLDGELPAEELLYFPAETKTAAPRLVVDNDLLSVASGTRCPKTGAWAIVEDLNARLRIEQDAVMPQHRGRDVQWVWIDK